MQTLNFDTNGFLTPYTNIEADLETLEKYFTFNDHRKAIFQNYLDYLVDFQNEICKDFVQWIDGSFVTLKEKPNDIDIVTFLDWKVYDLYEKQLSKFRGIKLHQSQKIDAYFVKVYPEEHKNFSLTEGDTKEWLNNFTNTRRNKQGKKFSKGFLELKFQ